MFIRPCYRKKDGKRHAYWALVESYRTERGPRQRVVAYLGQLDEAGRIGLRNAAEQRSDQRQQQLFDDTQPLWVKVNARAVRVENCRQFGGPWLALELIRKLGLHDFLKRTLPAGREEVPWSLTALILIIARLCEPSSELHIAEHFYRRTALADLLGVPMEKVDDNRLYRGLDALLPHKRDLEVYLKERLGELFQLEYDLLLYDVTSTFFEGAADFPMAQRGYSRDQRSDCKQVCIGLVVSRCGMPLGYEVFAGNTADVTTVEHIITTMEQRYGASDRVWVMDRGMVSEDNLEFLRSGGRRYIVGTPKSLLKKYEQELLKDDWRAIRDGLEVKLCPAPPSDDVASPSESKAEQELFILCRSQDRYGRPLRKAEARPDESGAGCGAATGPEHPRCETLRGHRGIDRHRPRAVEVAEAGGSPRLGDTQRRLLPAEDERPRLDGRGPLENLHAAHGSRGRLPDPEERSQPASNLASETGARAGAHSGLLPRVRAVEDAGPALRACRPGQRTTAGARRVERAADCRCDPADVGRHGTAQALHCQTE
jgi:hypothetical protein